MIGAASSTNSNGNNDPNGNNNSNNKNNANSSNSNSSSNNKVVCNYYFRGVELSCVVSDIIECDLDAICVSCDSTYSLSQGVGADVRRAGGLDFQRSLQAAPRDVDGRHGGAIAVPSARCGRLRSAFVILAPLRRSHRNCMNIVYCAIFRVAQEHGIRSLAVPALGTGLYGLSFENAARQMREALESFTTFHPIERIQFVDVNYASMYTLRDTFSELVVRECTHPIDDDPNAPTTGAQTGGICDAQRDNQAPSPIVIQSTITIGTESPAVSNGDTSPVASSNAIGTANSVPNVSSSSPPPPAKSPNAIPGVSSAATSGPSSVASLSSASVPAAQNTSNSNQLSAQQPQSSSNSTGTNGEKQRPTEIPQSQSASHTTPQPRTLADGLFVLVRGDAVADRGEIDSNAVENFVANLPAVSQLSVDSLDIPLPSTYSSTTTADEIEEEDEHEAPSPPLTPPRTIGPTRYTYTTSTRLTTPTRPATRSDAEFEHRAGPFTRGSTRSATGNCNPPFTNASSRGMSSFRARHRNYVNTTNVVNNFASWSRQVNSNSNTSRFGRFGNICGGNSSTNGYAQQRSSYYRGGSGRRFVPYWENRLWKRHVIPMDSDDDNIFAQQPSTSAANSTATAHPSATTANATTRNASLLGRRPATTSPPAARRRQTAGQTTAPSRISTNTPTPPTSRCRRRATRPAPTSTTTPSASRSRRLRTPTATRHTRANATRQKQKPATSSRAKKNGERKELNAPSKRTLRRRSNTYGRTSRAKRRECRRASKRLPHSRSSSASASSSLSATNEDEDDAESLSTGSESTIVNQMLVINSSDENEDETEQVTSSSSSSSHRSTFSRCSWSGSSSSQLDDSFIDDEYADENVAEISSDLSYEPTDSESLNAECSDEDDSLFEEHSDADSNENDDVDNEDRNEELDIDDDTDDDIFDNEINENFNDSHIASNDSIGTIASNSLNERVAPSVIELNHAEEMNAEREILLNTTSNYNNNSDGEPNGRYGYRTADDSAPDNDGDMISNTSDDPTIDFEHGDECDSPLQNEIRIIGNLSQNDSASLHVDNVTPQGGDNSGYGTESSQNEAAHPVDDHQRVSFRNEPDSDDDSEMDALIGFHAANAVNCAGRSQQQRQSAEIGDDDDEINDEELLRAMEHSSSTARSVSAQPPVSSRIRIESRPMVVVQQPQGIQSRQSHYQQESVHFIASNLTDHGPVPEGKLELLKARSSGSIDQAIYINEHDNHEDEENGYITDESIHFEDDINNFTSRVIIASGTSHGGNNNGLWMRVDSVELEALRAQHLLTQQQQPLALPQAKKTRKDSVDGNGGVEIKKASLPSTAKFGDEMLLPCSICLFDLLPAQDAGESTLSATPSGDVVRLDVCSHMFHENCIKMAFAIKRQCPLCMRWSAPAEGNQPLGAQMRSSIVRGRVPGYPDARGFIEIRYTIPSGYQTAQHPRPGLPYYGVTRIAYLPNNAEGMVTLSLLQLAFERRLLFTVGDSITTGQRNTVIWNGIHHKTSKTGGTSNYGYPDPGYLERVQEELKQVGIRKDLLR